MLLNRTAPLLHIVEFRTGRLIYLKPIGEDIDASTAEINKQLREGSFPNLEFQHAYNLSKDEYGLLDPDPNDILCHKFVTIIDSNGYGVGHRLIREYISSGDGLDRIANVGDWLADEGYIDVTPADQDARRFVRVTDIGKYYASKGAFDTKRFPMYILVSENSQITANGLIESHRDPLPDRGYDKRIIRGQDGIIILRYAPGIANSEGSEKPFSANGLLYTSVDQFAKAKDLPVQYILDEMKQCTVFATTNDWRFV